MNFSKEQKDYIIHALEHCEVLTGGRRSGKTLELIKQQEGEIERLNNIIKTKDEGIKAFTEDLCETSIELEKANNIINSINDYLVRNMLNHSLEFTYHLGFKETYDYLQKLKGSDK